eukprot:UN23827
MRFSLNGGASRNHPTFHKKIQPDLKFERSRIRVKIFWFCSNSKQFQNKCDMKIIFILFNT